MPLDEPRDAALVRVLDSHLNRLVRLAQHPDGPLRRRSPRHAFRDRSYQEKLEEYGPYVCNPIVLDLPTDLATWERVLGSRPARSLWNNDTEVK